MGKPCHYRENQWVSGRKEAWADENALDANVLLWTMKYITGAWDTEGAWRPACASICNYRYICPWSHESLLPEVRKMTPFNRWEMISQVPEDCWLLSPRNPPEVHSFLGIWTAIWGLGSWTMTGMAGEEAGCHRMGCPSYLIIELLS